MTLPASCSFLTAALLAAVLASGCASSARDDAPAPTTSTTWPADRRVALQAAATMAGSAVPGATGSATPSPTATRTPTAQRTPPPPYNITGNVVIDGATRRIFARGDAGEGERTLIFDAENGALRDAIEPAGMLAIDVADRRLYIDDVTRGLTTVDLDDLGRPWFTPLRALPRPTPGDPPDPEHCTIENLAPIATEVPPIVV